MKFQYVLLLWMQCAAFLSSGKAIAQSGFNYTPLKDDVIKIAGSKKIITGQYLRDSLNTQGENKKYILEIYRDRYKSINELFDNKELIAASEVDAYLTSITNEIISKNPELKTIAPHFFFSRSWVPNAYSTGEGTIVFNIGLFTKLKNESQVAFVICHELAHLFLQHSNKKIEKHISMFYSDEFQKTLKKLQKKEFDRKAELDKLEMGMAFKSFRHSRDSESEADSTGLYFLQHTNYDCGEALTALALLDDIDAESIDINSSLKKLFTTAEFPFKDRWLQQEEVFFGGLEKKEKPIDDSLKTHPDCQVRIKKLTPVIEKIAQENTRKFLQPEQQFAEVQMRFQFEIINYCIAQKKVSRAMFYAVQLLEKYPENSYLVGTAGECFNEMYIKQKEHLLNTIAELPSPYREKKYNTILEFISRLSLKDINSLGYYFLKQYTGKFNNDENFKKIYEKSNQYFKNNQQATQL